MSLEDTMKTLVLFCMAIALAGCHSFRTTAVDRCENDTIVVNPEKPLHGIPIALRIPTHLDLKVIETTYWEKTTGEDGRPTLTPLRTCRPTRDVEHTVKETEKIFLVDPVRPAAGLVNYGFEFQQNSGKGYLKKVNYMIDDQTITQSADLIANSLGLIDALRKSANTQASPNTADLISTDRVIAFCRFDINSPTFECDVAQFLECQLNNGPPGQCTEVCEGSFCPIKQLK
jgi:hypothetical protein